MSIFDGFNKRKDDRQSADPVMTREGLLLQLFGARTTSQQVELMIQEFERWNKSGDKNLEVLSRAFMQITAGRLTEADAEVAGKLLLMEKHLNLDKMMAMFGAGNMGTDADEIPGGVSIFGHNASNPVPTRGIPGSEEYLSSLRTRSGHKLRWNRIGSFQPKNIKSIVDGYEVADQTTGEELGIIYLCPYHKRNSGKAPDGFYLELAVKSW